MQIIVGARASRLSQAQVAEVLAELSLFHPEVRFSPLWVETTGDIDQITSLKTLDKTDFFTKEIDQLLKEGKCRIAIHSAKDLPEPLPFGLAIVALTQGVDPSDSLVLRAGESLPLNAKVGTSSKRREEELAKMRADLQFVDVRGPIEKRLQLLETQEVDGLVVAEAALIRLKLTHLNRIRLNIPTAPLQGKLAIIARKDDEEMRQLFSCINWRVQ
jgi:hydroxymethylbilane synthase